MKYTRYFKMKGKKKRWIWAGLSESGLTELKDLYQGHKDDACVSRVRGINPKE